MAEYNDITNSSEQLNCKCCKTTVTENDSFCPNCGFPLKGTIEEQGEFIGKFLTKKNEEQEWKRQVNNARTTLAVVGVLMIVTGGFYGLMNRNSGGEIIFVVNLIIGLIYFFLSWWSNKNPFGAILTGLIIFISIYLLQAFINPSSLIEGVIIKVVVVTYMINGVVSAAKVRNMSH